MTERDSRSENVPVDPIAERPAALVAYGVSAESEGMLPWSWAEERLARSRNYWICTTRPDGRPHAAPVWGVWVGDALYFGTGRASRKARNLAANPEVIVHLESGDEVILFEGRAVERDEPPPAAGEAFAGKYGMETGEAGGEGAVWYEVRPRVAQAWLETDFLRSAVRWTFLR